MTCMIQKILVTSISLLMIHTATAQPISASALTLEQGLYCLDWAEKEQSFSNQLALGDIEEGLDMVDEFYRGEDLHQFVLQKDAFDIHRNLKGSVTALN